MRQQTIKQGVHAQGIGLHSGQPVDLYLKPLPIDHGVIFQRVDLPQQPQIKAQAHLVNDTVMSSNLVQDGIRIGTVEHILSAVAGLGIDNLLIQVSAAEIPIMDGSAAQFVDLLLSAGIKSQEAAKAFIQIIEPIRVQEEDKWAELLPFNGFELNFEIDFNHPAFLKEAQVGQLKFSSRNFMSELSQARTFGFLKDIELLRQQNLALGGSLDNAIVLDEEKILNKEGLRYQNEFVRHKILDAVGDLYLIGKPLLGKFNAFKSGHALNNQLVRQVLDKPNSFQIVTFDDNVISPIDYDMQNIMMSSH